MAGARKLTHLTKLQCERLQELYDAYDNPVDTAGKGNAFAALARKKLAVRIDAQLYRISLRGLLVMRGKL